MSTSTYSLLRHLLLTYEAKCEYEDINAAEMPLAPFRYERHLQIQTALRELEEMRNDAN